MTIAVDHHVELVPITPADAPALYSAVERNRLRLREWLPWVTDDYSLAHMTSFLKAREIDNAARVSLTMAIRADGVVCGAIGLHLIDRANRNSSIGYWLDAAYEGRGIMTRACRSIIATSFEDYGLHRVEIRCAIQNVKSCSIPKRLGMREEGILREAEWIRDHWVDLRVFSLLDRDWKSQ